MKSCLNVSKHADLQQLLFIVVVLLVRKVELLDSPNLFTLLLASPLTEQHRLADSDGEQLESQTCTSVSCHGDLTRVRQRCDDGDLGLTLLN